MIIDRDPGDETDVSTERYTPSVEARVHEPSELERITALLSGTGTVSQRALDRLFLAQRQHHQGRGLATP